jgi:Protein of unknown function, DUF481
VHWAEVAGVSSPRDFEVTLESGDRLYGALGFGPTAGQLVVTQQLLPGQTVALAEVTSIVPIGSSLWSRIDGNFDVGLTVAQANRETHYTVNGGGSYRSRRYRIGTSLASQLTSREDADRILRNTLTLNGSRLYDNRWFVTVLGQIQQNDELQLNLRTVGGAGGGRALSTTNHRSIAVYSGLVYTREQFVDQPVDNSAEVAVGAQADFFTPKNNDFTLTNNIVTYYSVSGRGRARVELQSAWRHEFLSDFYWSLNGIESFDSDPPNSEKRNDFSLSLSIGWKF